MITTSSHSAAEAMPGNDNRRGGFSASGLRPADAVQRPGVRVEAGPFDASNRQDRDASGVSGALMTGLLVVYPAFATVAAIVIGLFLSGPVGGA